MIEGMLAQGNEQAADIEAEECAAEQPFVQDPQVLHQCPAAHKANEERGERYSYTRKKHAEVRQLVYPQASACEIRHSGLRRPKKLFTVGKYHVRQDGTTDKKLVLFRGLSCKPLYVKKRFLGFSRIGERVLSSFCLTREGKTCYAPSFEKRNSGRERPKSRSPGRSCTR